MHSVKDIQDYLKKTFEVKNKSKILTIGVHEEDNGRSDGEVNSEVLASHVFGVISRNLPVRDPILEPVERRMDEIIDLFLSSIVSDIQSQKTIEESIINAFNKVGSFITIDIVKDEFLTEGQGKWKKLSQATIDKKGFDTILIETKQLMNSIKYKIRAENLKLL